MQQRRPLIGYESSADRVRPRRSSLATAAAVLSLLGGGLGLRLFACGWGVGDTWVIQPRIGLVLFAAVGLLSVPTAARAATIPTFARARSKPKARSVVRFDPHPIRASRLVHRDGRFSGH